MRKRHSTLIDNTSSESADESSNESSNESSSETFTGSFDGSAAFEETLETLDLEDGLEVPKGYRLIDVSYLGTAISCLECPECHTQNLTLCETTSNYGLASIMVFQCTACNYSINIQTSQKIVCPIL